MLRFIYSVFIYQTSVVQTSYRRIALWLVSKERGGYWTKWSWPTLSYCPGIAWRNWEESCKFVVAARQPVIWTREFPHMKEEAHERNLWWTKWRWDGFLSKYFLFLLSVSFHHCCIFIHSFTKPITYAIECQQATASLNSRRTSGSRSALLFCVIISSPVLAPLAFHF